MRAGRASLLLVGMALALSGCTFGGPAHPSATATDDVASTSPTSTASSDALSAPRSAIPAGCTQLLPTAAAVAAFPATSGVVLRESETSAPSDILTVSAKQAGGLHCLWGGTQRTDNGYDDSVRLDVIGAAADDYRQNVVPNPGDEVNTVGTASTLQCQGDPQFFCSAQVLVGTTWFELDYVSLGGTGEPASGSLARFHTLLAGVAGRVAAAGPDRALWTPPAAWDGASLCDATALARVRSATGATDLVATDYALEGPRTAASAGLARVGIQSCGWTREASSGLTTFGIQFVQGGAWAVAAEVDQPPTDYQGSFAPVTIPGATAAVAACNEAFCQADLAVGGSWLTVMPDGLTTMDQLVHVVSTLLASTPH